MADNRRGKDRRYYFTLGQMVLLAMAFVLTSTVIFFLGMFIGQGIEARKVVRPEEPLIKMPVKPLAQGAPGRSAAPAKEELTFYETLTKSPQSRLTSQEKVKDDRGLGKPIRRELKETRPEPTNDPVPAVPKATEKKPEPPTPVAPTAANQTLDTAERKENGKAWSVQVNAFPDERSAKQLVDRLNNKGYNAVISEARNKGKTWYRVRVGKYGSREEADKALEDLKSKEKFEKAFATSRQQ